MQEIVVEAEKINSKFEELSDEYAILKFQDIQKNLSNTIASTLKNEVGVAVTSTGPAIARPVIKGLGSNRIILAEDGFPSNDLSYSSLDHAVAIEPYSAEKIEILRGPKSVIYTSSFGGGIINVSKNEIYMNQIDKEQLTGGLFFNSVNSGKQGIIKVAAPINNFTIWSIAGYNKTNNIRSPEKTLDNTYSDNITYSLGSSYNKIDFTIGNFFESFQLDYGVPGGFVGSHPNGSDIKIDKKDYNLRLDYHFHYDFLDNIKLLFQRSYYHHIEYESNGSVAAEFVNRMIYTKLIFNQKEINFGDGKLLGAYGVDINYNDRKTGGFVFTPPSKLLNLSSFIYEDFSISNYFFQIGLRLSYDKYLPRIIATTKNPELLKDRDFLNIGTGLSIMREIFTNNYFGMSIYHSEKSPTLEELFNEGPHLAAYSYEVGNPKLNKELGNGLELYYYYKTDFNYFFASFFYNYYDSYIIARNSGEMNYTILLPIYEASDVNSQIYGFDVAYVHNFNPFKIESNISAVYGEILDSNQNLPAIPPLKGKLELTYNKNHINLGMFCNFAAAQNLTDKFEEKTPGYIIFNFYGAYSFEFGTTYHIISLNIENIFDSIYYNHLSRIKSIMPEAGRGFQIRYRFFY